jgi:RNA-dependent RNA polymerase
VGAADVHGFLKPDEVHICVRCPHCHQDCHLEGRTVVSRSPTIHPGDVQILTAVGKPGPDSPFYTEPLRQCIIFSTQGQY